MCPCIVTGVGGEYGKGNRIGSDSEIAAIAHVGNICTVDHLIGIGIRIDDGPAANAISAVGGSDITGSRSRRTGNIGKNNSRSGRC